MKLNDILLLKFPQADFEKDILLKDDGDGKIYIGQWNLNVPRPSQSDIDVWKEEVKNGFIFAQNKILNNSIYTQLNNIDFKSIRALREKDIQKLADLESQAISLRAQLLPVS